MKVPLELESVIPPGGVFKNTKRFSEVGNYYSSHGYYVGANKKSKEYIEFWDREAERCLNGYEIDGVRITGYHYFYLNYCPIPSLDVSSIGDNTNLYNNENSAVKVEGFPRFWDGDYYYYHAVEIARRLGKHLIVIKARGKGYSHKNSSMLARNFHLLRNSKNYGLAFEKEFLLKDGLLSKTWDKIDFISDNTAWIQPKLIDQEMHKMCGYKAKVGGIYILRGRKNQIIGVSLKDDPDKARGKRGEVILWEEAGKFPGLFKAFDVARPSVEEGRYATGIMIVFGTGGTEGSNFEGLEDLFYHPESNNCFAIENIWDDGARGNKCGFFIPAYNNYEGFIDEDGNSDEEGARAYLEEQRDLKKKNSKDSRGYDQFVAEFPFTPREATLNIGGNLFPIKELQSQLDSVNASRRYDALSTGFLYRDYTNKVLFKIDSEANPIFKFPTPEKSNTDGCVWILEAPFRDRNGNVPDNLYYMGHDPYAHDKTTGPSLGAAYIFKNTNNFSPSYNECIVASYVGRPSNQDEYNYNLFLLAQYYNCKIGFENDRGDVIGYAKRHKLLHLLAEEFKMLDKKELQSRTVRRSYGMHMTPRRKEQGEIYIRDWLNSRVTTLEDGTEKKILHTILDPALLEELIKFTFDGNFDRVMAVMIGQYYSKELYNSKVLAREEHSPFVEFMSRKLFPA